MDSWFGLPSVISALWALLPVICVVKRTPKILYGFGGKRPTLEGIYRLLKKRRGRAMVLASTVVTFNDGQNARLVFVQNSLKNDWSCGSRAWPTGRSAKGLAAGRHQSSTWQKRHVTGN